MTAASAALFKQALAKFHAHDVRGGWDDLDEAIRLDPSQWEYFWTRGAFHYRRHAYYSAEEDLTQAVDLCPDDKSAAKIHERRMFCYGYLEKLDQVVQDADWLINTASETRTSTTGAAGADFGSVMQMARLTMQI